MGRISLSAFGRNSNTTMKQMILTLLQRAFLTLAAGLVLTGTAHAWWDSDWTLRKKITIDTGDRKSVV